MTLKILQSLEFEYPRVLAYGACAAVFGLLLVHWLQVRSGVLASRSRALEWLRWVAVMTLPWVLL